MTGAVVVLVTAPQQDAERIVTTLVQEQLTACGNIVPGVLSIYRWDDRIQRDQEVLIVFKTTRAAAPALMARVDELHPYDVPEALVLPVDAGLAPYLEWVAANSAS